MDEDTGQVDNKAVEKFADLISALTTPSISPFILPEISADLYSLWRHWSEQDAIIANAVRDGVDTAALHSPGPAARQPGGPRLRDAVTVSAQSAGHGRPGDAVH